jgi:N6-adenosine-specific RNA methylase IME4
LSKITAHLYLWVPNALLPEGLRVLAAWGFEYKSNIVWHKIRKDGGPDGRGVGFYFRNTTELILFGVRGKNARTLAPGRRQVNIIKSRKREHSRKPDEAYDLIESCSPGPFLEMFARGSRAGWTSWGQGQADANLCIETAAAGPDWPTYSAQSTRRCEWRLPGVKSEILAKPFDSGASGCYSDRRSAFHILTLEHSNWARSFTLATSLTPSARASSNRCSPRTVPSSPRK